MSTWSAIVGPLGSGKPTLALDLAHRLRAHGLTVGGFIQPDARTASGELIGWDVQELASGERRALARRSTTPALCDYAFDAEAFATARSWLQASRADVLIAHAVGKLEAAGHGHWPALKAVLDDPTAPHLVLCIRDTCLAAIVLALDDPRCHIELPSTTSELDRFARELAQAAAA